jgi:small subunit ribosomal protein S6
MATYETLFITPPTLTDAEEATLVGGFAAVIREGGGQLVARESMGRRRLAYPIQRHDDGVYTLLLYDAAPAVPRELERRIRLSDKVLRWVTVRLDEEWAAEAKVQAARQAEARERAEAARVAAAEPSSAEAAGAALPAGSPTASESAAVAERPRTRGSRAAGGRRAARAGGDEPWNEIDEQEDDDDEEDEEDEEELEDEEGGEEDEEDDR